MKKAIIILLACVFLIVLFTGLKLFVIGGPADGETLAIEVKEWENQVTLYISCPDSAIALTDISYRYEGTVLHMTVQKVLSSPIHNDGSICLYYEIVDETEIWVGGKQVWKANP